MLELLFELLVGHAVADFALQSDVMAKGKNRHNKVTPPPGQEYKACWPMWLLAHGLIHGGVVYYITGSVALGVFETITHSAIDFCKCEGLTEPYSDQIIHLTTKIFYMGIMV